MNEIQRREKEEEQKNCIDVRTYGEHKYKISDRKRTGNIIETRLECQCGIFKYKVELKE